MSKLILNYQKEVKEIQIQSSPTPNQLLRLLQSAFQTREEILGITDQFGKFYDLLYASKHTKSLHNHKFNIVTARDAANNVSFGSRKSSRNGLRNSLNERCLGVISDMEMFKQIMPNHMIVAIMIKKEDSIQFNIPFDYYLIRGDKKKMQIWHKKEIQLECQLFEKWQGIIKGISNYLIKEMQQQMKDNDFSDLGTKQTMLLDAIDQLYRDSVISELQFYKKKVIILEKPVAYISKYLPGQTIDRCLLVQRIRQDFMKNQDEARIFNIISESENKEEIPILVRKSTNVIEKVTKQHTLSVQQEQILNILLQFQLKGLITQNQFQIYQNNLLQQNRKIMHLFELYLNKQFDQINLARKLRQIFKDKRQQKKLIQ